MEIIPAFSNPGGPDMRALRIMCVTLMTTGLAGCAALGMAVCMPYCGASHASSSSLVEFLYPGGQLPPRDNSIPELQVPLRVGLAFLPARGGAAGPDAAQREELLARIRARFSSRKFVTEIVIIPDYYLASQRGFAGLEAVQRLYSIDLMALVSYDQVTHRQENGWSLGYLTIVGAYLIKGDRYDVATLLDLAVVDPGTHSLVLRAGGVDTRHGATTLNDQPREFREADSSGFSAAADQLIEHFDTALTAFEAEVRAGRANVRVVHKSGSGTGGGAGEFSWPWLLPLLGLVLVRVRRRGRGALRPQ
jgi:rhombotail lipoprotein